MGTCGREMRGVVCLKAFDEKDKNLGDFIRKLLKAVNKRRKER